MIGTATAVGADDADATTAQAKGSMAAAVLEQTRTKNGNQNLKGVNQVAVLRHEVGVLVCVSVPLLHSHHAHSLHERANKWRQ